METDFNFTFMYFKLLYVTFSTENIFTAISDSRKAFSIVNISTSVLVFTFLKVVLRDIKNFPDPLRLSHAQHKHREYSS